MTMLLCSWHDVEECRETAQTIPKKRLGSDFAKLVKQVLKLKEEKVDD